MFGNWIDVLDGQRTVSIWKNSDRLVVQTGNGGFGFGRPLTEIEKKLADEIFDLRAEIFTLRNLNTPPN